MPSTTEEAPVLQQNTMLSRPKACEGSRRTAAVEETTMNVVLRVVVGEGAGQDVSVSGPTFMIGRAPDCDLRPNCPWLSPHHCELTVNENGVLVRNRDSRHETFVNSERLNAERRLKSGDRLGVGWNLFEVRFT